MEPTIFQGQDLINIQVEEAHSLAVKPGVHLGNPLVPGGDALVRVIDQRHEYKMMHLVVPEDVLQPQASCEVWNPSAKSYMTSAKITCQYYEVMEELCPDEFLASCWHNLISKAAAVEGVMVNSSQEISAITAAVIVGLNAAIASSTHKVAWFSDPDFGAAGYHSNAKVNYLAQRSVKERDRMIAMLNKNEGIDTILRRRAGDGLVAFVNTNDGTAANNATLPANIQPFLQDMLLASSEPLRYWHKLTGQYPVFKLQSGLYYAYINWLETLTGGADQHRFIVNGTPVEGVYNFRGYPVMEWHEADLFDFAIGLKNPATGHSWNQRAIFCAPGNPTLLTNVKANTVGTGLAIQTSPNISDKGKTWMYMNLGVGSGIAHNSLVTYGYNTSYTYATS